jgi:hypothetical protein
MAVKRTTGVSSAISSIDRRVKAVESGKTSLDPRFANAASVVLSDDDDPENLDPKDTAGSDKKYEYKRVLKAYIYGAKVTGFGSRCELYFGEDPQIEAADPVDVQGVHGTSTDNFNISPKQFKVFDVDSSPWTGRQSWRNTPTTGNNGDTITNTVWFNPVVEVPSSYPRTSGRELITTRRIDTVDIDGATVTVNLNSTHRFELGDIISVDLPQPAFGIDGVFRISDVPDTSTIVYQLDAPLGSPVSLDSSDFTGGEAYVYPVARRYVKDGTVWVDKSVEPNRVWVWNVLRWYDTAESPLSQVPGADSIAPSPVTNLTVTSDSQEVATPGAPGKASITLEWDAPTTNENSTPITDLGGYSVRWRYSVSEKWRITEIDDPAITSWYQEDFIYNVPVYLAVYAKDKSGNRSTASTTSITTAASPAPELKAPAAPTVTGYLGTMKVFWNGLDAEGNAAHISAFEVELHISTDPNFTADETTLYERFPAINGPTYTVIPGNAVIAGAPIVDNQTYYFKFKFIDVWGNRTGQSLESSFVGQKSNIVTFDMIDVGTVDGEVLIGAEIRTRVNPAANPGGGVILDNSGFTAYNAVGVQSFNINFATGAVSIPGSGSVTIANYATSDRANAIEQVAISANSIAVTANTNAGTALTTAVSANGIAVIANSTASNTNTTVSAFTTIEAGVVKISKSNVISSINNDNGNTTTIDGGTITTGTIEANLISANAITAYLVSGREIRLSSYPANDNSNPKISLTKDRIAAFRTNGSTSFRLTKDGDFYGDDIFIDTATLSGSMTVSGNITTTTGSVRTASSGRRVVLDGATDSLRFIGSDENEKGEISAGTTNMVLDAPSGIAFQSGGVTVFSLNSTGVALAPGEKFNSNLPVEGTITATGSISSSGSFIRTGSPDFATLGSGGEISRSALAGATVRFANITTGGFIVAGATVSSDERLKTDITETQIGLDFVNQLNPVQFKFRSPDSPLDSGIQFGVIAQQIRDTLLEHGVDEENGVVYKPIYEDNQEEYYSVNHIQLISPLIKAIQELSAKNNALEARLAALEGNG